MFTTSKISYLFIGFALAALLAGLFFGAFSAVQYVIPDFLKETLPFNRMRPLHVTFVISWIILCATGIIYYAVSSVSPSTKKNQWGSIHFYLFLATGIIIAVCYLLGIFGGREYFEFPPLLIVPVLAGWVLFGFLFLKTIFSFQRPLPVYVWMWATGILFMGITLIEANLWLIPYFRDNIIRDMTVQWKSYGAMIGSWNMLVYGIAAYTMNRIHAFEKTIRGPLPFLLYFLGFAALLFGWGHHTYIIPAQPWVRTVSYAISMTELIILGIMIWDWRKSFILAGKNRNDLSFKFLFAADQWVVLNLVLAILISIPALNYFTHGTHITVAHAMGTTIGINTTILLGAVLNLLMESGNSEKFSTGTLKTGFYIFNFSLLIFWITMILMGLKRSIWMYSPEVSAFSELNEQSVPYYWVFILSGIGVFTGIFLIVFGLLPMVKRKISCMEIKDSMIGDE